MQFFWGLARGCDAFLIWKLPLCIRVVFWYQTSSFISEVRCMFWVCGFCFVFSALKNRAAAGFEGIWKWQSCQLASVPFGVSHGCYRQMTVHLGELLEGEA